MLNSFAIVFFLEKFESIEELVISSWLEIARETWLLRGRGLICEIFWEYWKLFVSFGLKWKWKLFDGRGLEKFYSSFNCPGVSGLMDIHF